MRKSLEFPLPENERTHLDDSAVVALAQWQRIFTYRGPVLRWWQGYK